MTLEVRFVISSIYNNNLRHFITTWIFVSFVMVPIILIEISVWNSIFKHETRVWIIHNDINNKVDI